MSLAIPIAPPSRAEVAARLADPDALARVVPTRFDDSEAGGPLPPLRAAAVLVPIVWHEAGAGVLLTLRSAKLTAHAGQVAFPGGRIEPGETPEAAAVREAAEEVGLDPRLPELVATLPEHQTGTGFRVTPVVAFLDPPLDLTPTRRRCRRCSSCRSPPCSTRTPRSAGGRNSAGVCGNSGSGRMRPT
jgi:ADP-ribose pyrophosphatase YjhB (NUDIX family)